MDLIVPQNPVHVQYMYMYMDWIINCYVLFDL